MTWARVTHLQKTFLGDDLLKDMLVLSSAQGHLYASYLGTDPAIFSVPAIAREVNYEETDKEYAELTSHIKAAQSDGKAVGHWRNPGCRRESGSVCTA